MLRGARSDDGWSEGAADTVEGVLSDRTRR
jgi:hypothetical protein